MKAYSYLALGDSYTIGEQVLPEENFPNQTVAILNKTTEGFSIKTAGWVNNRHQGFEKPNIIAQTGWTTDELDAGIDKAQISKQYDIVSLLIGVNNQYRGRTIVNFEIEFEHLLQRAIQFANNMADHIFVLSIPDWGVTPFAEGSVRKKIAEEIDAFNAVCKAATEKFGTHFIDITLDQRTDGSKVEFLAADTLHPSGREYAKWAKKLANAIITIL